MNQREKNAIRYGLIIVTAISILLTLARATVAPELSLLTCMSPFGVPVLVVYGLLFGAVWDRFLRGKNVRFRAPSSKRGGHGVAASTFVAAVIAGLTMQGYATGYGFDDFEEAGE